MHNSKSPDANNLHRTFSNAIKEAQEASDSDDKTNARKSRTFSNAIKEAHPYETNLKINSDDSDSDDRTSARKSRTFSNAIREAHHSEKETKVKAAHLRTFSSALMQAEAADDTMTGPPQGMPPARPPGWLQQLKNTQDVQ